MVGRMKSSNFSVSELQHSWLVDSLPSCQCFAVLIPKVASSVTRAVFPRRRPRPSSPYRAKGMVSSKLADSSGL